MIQIEAIDGENGEIVLVRIRPDKTIPSLILAGKNPLYHGLCIARVKEGLPNSTTSQDNPPSKKHQHPNNMIKELNHDNKSSINIGHPAGLHNESRVLFNREITFLHQDIIKTITSLSTDMFRTVCLKYMRYQEIINMHQELHLLKKKVEICKLNNENYKEIEQRIEAILRELKYPINVSRENYRAFAGFRVAPNEHNIRFFRG